MTESERLMAEDWTVIEAMLPKGWERKAEELGAWDRVRGFRGKKELLRTLLIHLALGCPLKETAVRARQADFADVSSVALFKRLRKSGEWLRWMAFGVMQKWLVPSRQAPWSMDLPLKVIDGATVRESGAKGTTRRVHYTINLPSMTCDEFKVTSPAEGEWLRHFTLKSGDIVLGDSAYAYRGRIAAVVNGGGAVVVRMGPTNLPSYDSRGRPFNVLARVRRLKDGNVGDWDVWFVHKDTVVRGRICAVRKSLTSRKAARARYLRECGQNRTRAKPEPLEAAEYVIVFTTLCRSVPAEKVVEIYRCRWQFEPAFKRLKSILGLGNLKKIDHEGAKAWLHGKLLVAALIQALISAGSTYYPWGFPIGNSTGHRPVYLEGTLPHDETLSSGNHSGNRDSMVHTRPAEQFTRTRRRARPARFPSHVTCEQPWP